jgi:hypothetical protein
MKKAHTFEVLIHLDVVEYLMFYHYPRDELLVDGKTPWREFDWRYGVPDGDLQEEDFSSNQRLHASYAT